MSAHGICSMTTPRREAAAITDPGPAKRRAATLVLVMPSSPSAARADDAVARAPSTRADAGWGTPERAHARRIAEAMPVTSVLNPASTPAEGTTVLTAPTALASGSIASRRGITACLQGIVTDSPPHCASMPPISAGRLSLSHLMRRYSHPLIPSASQAAR